MDKDPCADLHTAAIRAMNEYFAAADAVRVLTSTKPERANGTPATDPQDLQRAFDAERKAHEMYAQALTALKNCEHMP